MQAIMQLNDALRELEIQAAESAAARVAGEDRPILQTHCDEIIPVRDDARPLRLEPSTGAPFHMEKETAYSAVLAKQAIAPKQLQTRSDLPSRILNSPAEECHPDPMWLSRLTHAASPLLLLSEDGHPGNVDILDHLLVTLAALSEDPVLAIDASGGRLGKHFFGFVETDPTLPTAAAKDWRSSITQTNHPGLCLMPPDHGKDLMLDPSFPFHLNEMRSYFGLIVIDGGRVDRQTLRRLTIASNGILFLVRIALTSAKWAQTVRNQVVAWGGSPLGSIATLPPDAAA
jgi:hypothetical protein